MFNKARSQVSILLLVAVWAACANPVRATIIVNGDFSSGNVGFTSDYGYASVSDPGGGHYTVGTNPHAWNSYLSSFGDHTTGNGNMLIADGSGTANTRVWVESVALTPNTQYTMTFYAASNGNDNFNGIDPSPATLIATANGTSFGPTLNVPATNGVWGQFTGTFNSGASGTVTLAITDSNLNGGAGNDFAIDDISAVAVPQPSSLTLLVVAIGPAALIATRRYRRPAIL